MCNMYDEFLRRVEQYRLLYKMTQEEVSNKIGITQSQFSKMELGKTIFPNYVLKSLSDMNWDIDYLITGKETPKQSSEIIEILNQYETENREEFLQLILWTLKQGIHKQKKEIDSEIKCEMQVLFCRNNHEKSTSLLYEVREVLGLSQHAMAEKLGVNIKKYRMLEKEIIQPDAELLVQIYKISRCKPTLFLYKERMEEAIINDLWTAVRPEIRNELITFLKQAEQLLGR